MNRLKVGDIVPKFESKDDTGQLFSSEDYKGKRWIAFFYPRASTPGCTMEACSLRDDFDAIVQKGYHIVGISADSQKKQSNFKEKHKFPYPLLADEEKIAINTFGVWGEKAFMGKTYQGIHRITFLIDEEGKITHVIDKVRTKDHAKQILDMLKEEA